MCIFERCAKPDTGTLPAALQRKARGAMCQRAGKRQRICSGHPYLRGAPGTGRVQKNEVRPQLKQPAHGTQHKAGVKIGAQQRGTRFDGQCGQGRAGRHFSEERPAARRRCRAGRAAKEKRRARRTARPAPGPAGRAKQRCTPLEQPAGRRCATQPKIPPVPRARRPWAPSARRRPAGHTSPGTAATALRAKHPCDMLSFSASP